LNGLSLNVPHGKIVQFIDADEAYPHDTLEGLMEEKQCLMKPDIHKRSTKGRSDLNSLPFEDRLFLDAITRAVFPDRLKHRCPKFFDRLQGRLESMKLESMKREVIRFYRKEQNLKRRQCEQ